jgi:hypothetical protein
MVHVAENIVPPYSFVTAEVHGREEVNNET